MYLRLFVRGICDACERQNAETSRTFPKVKYTFEVNTYKTGENKTTHDTIQICLQI